MHASYTAIYEGLND